MAKGTETFRWLGLSDLDACERLGKHGTFREAIEASDNAADIGWIVARIVDDPPMRTAVCIAFILCAATVAKEENEGNVEGCLLMAMQQLTEPRADSIMRISVLQAAILSDGEKRGRIRVEGWESEKPWLHWEAEGRAHALAWQLLRGVLLIISHADRGKAAEVVRSAFEIIDYLPRAHRAKLVGFLKSGIHYDDLLARWDAQVVEGATT